MKFSGTEIINSDIPIKVGIDANLNPWLLSRHFLICSHVLFFFEYKIKGTVWNHMESVSMAFHSQSGLNYNYRGTIWGQMETLLYQSHFLSVSVLSVVRLC